MGKKFDWRSTAHRIVPTTEADGYQHVHGAKVLEVKPPVYDNCVAAFQINPRTIFTYGDTIYNPFKLHLPEDLIEHEKVHMAQHNHNDADAAIWWGKYLRDPKFRFEQEAEAYKRQWQVFQRLQSDRNAQTRFLEAIVGFLSGPVYANCATPEEARAAITSA